MSPSTAPCSWGQAAMKSFCCFGTVGFDVEVFQHFGSSAFQYFSISVLFQYFSISAVTLELALLIPPVKVYCHHLTCQGWDTARTAAVEVGMQKGTQPEETTERQESKN